MKKIYVVGQKVTESFCIEGSGWQYCAGHNDIYGIYTEEKRNDAIEKFLKLKEKDITNRSSFELKEAFIKESYLDKEYEEKDITKEILEELENKKENMEVEKMEEGEVKIIDIAQLGAEIGMEEKEQTLSNGKLIKSLVWDKENLLKAVEHVKHLSGEGADVKITGAAPAWLVSALTHTVHPSKVSVYVPQINKDVEIPLLAHGEQNKEGEVAFKVTEKKDSILVEFNMDLPEGVTAYDENNLPKVVVPDISNGKAVYISGRGPNYLTVAIAEAYAHTNSSVSLFQPGIGYTCSITHSRAKNLGDLEKDPLGKEEIKEELIEKKQNSKEIETK